MKIAQIAVPSPLNRVFDYFWPDDSAIYAGQRVTVPFGRRTLVGVVVGEAVETTVASERMRQVTQVHDPEPLLPEDILSLLFWASRYYHHPVGEVLAAALPVSLRKGAAAKLPVLKRYRVLDDSSLAGEQLRSAPLQQALWQRVSEAGSEGVAPEQLKDLGRSWRGALQQLVQKGCVQEFISDKLPSARFEYDAQDGSGEDIRSTPPELLPEQHDAVRRIEAKAGQFQCFLLNGVTGSGKTEVYLRLIDQQVKAGLQVLVLVPEISLTPQLLRRFQRRLAGCIVSLHSAMNDTQRMHNWLIAALGKADVVIGTRSAVFTPLPRLGLIVVDEEHDGSLKQQDGFRYHGRDLALMRARNAGITVVLGSATPSLESFHNAKTGRYAELQLSQRAGDAQPPEIVLLDIRRRALTEGMSDRLLAMLRDNLGQGGQSLIFINRRGFAPTLLCNDCGAAAECRRCDAHMTVHAKLNCLRCHHCGAERGVPAVCESCGSESLDKVGQGTERIEAALRQIFPDTHIARIDRDSTRRRGALQKHLDEALSGQARILVGTQMLAKGHHFPGVTLVGILDCDRGLYGTDYRALEQMGQLIIQVAGRAGREKSRGRVLVQTRNPDNELLQVLVREGYVAFADRALDDRRAAQLPPFSYVALVRAEAADKQAPQQFLKLVAQALASVQKQSLQFFGPVAAPMERMGGRYRAQLMVQSTHRSELNQALAHITTVFEEAPEARRIRWSVDVDPVDFL